MKRWGAILLFCIYTLGATELEQLVRFPLLVQHYRQHKAKNPYISIAQFLYIHYVETQRFDDDYSQDMQLPFKQADIHLSYQWQLPTSTAFLWPQYFPSFHKYMLANDPTAASRYHPAVFKPPPTTGYPILS